VKDGVEWVILAMMFVLLGLFVGVSNCLFVSKVRIVSNVRRYKCLRLQGMT